MIAAACSSAFIRLGAYGGIVFKYGAGAKGGEEIIPAMELGYDCMGRL